MTVLGVSGTKAQIFGFLQGVAGTISGFLPTKRGGKKTAASKTVSSRTRPARKPRTGRKSSKTRRVRSRTGNARRLRKQPKQTEAVADSPSVASVPQTVVYSCPVCGLEAQEGPMAEHLLGSPGHQLSPAKPEPSAVERVEEEQVAASRDEDSRQALRNLLQILVPPRAFGRRHEQKTVNPISYLVQTSDSKDTSS